MIIVTVSAEGSLVHVAVFVQRRVVALVLHVLHVHRAVRSSC